MSKPLPLGKLSQSLLSELIQELPIESPEILIPPGIGRDAAGLQIGNKRIAVTMDPITFASNHLATYSVCVNINDVACLGCRPKWYAATLLLSPKTTEPELRKIWKELSEQLVKYQIHAIGGHTEVTDNVKAPMIIGQIIGESISDKLLDPVNGKAGDRILLWQNISIEGTALIANERKKDLQKYFSPDEIRRMQQFLENPGICVWPFVEKLLPHPDVIALHDPTEGGLATALHEIADATQCGVKIQYDSIPFLPETKHLEELLKFDPLGLIASGCLIILCTEEGEEKILEKYKDEPIVAIGKLTEAPKERVLVKDGIERDLPRFYRDEIINALDAKV